MSKFYGTSLFSTRANEPPRDAALGVSEEFRGVLLDPDK